MSGGVLRSTAQLQGVLPALGPGGRIVAAPSQFIFTGSESLRINVWFATVGPTLLVQGRYRDDESGDIKPFEFRIPLGTVTSAGLQRDFTLPAGTLYNLRVGILEDGATYGLIFVRAQQVQGSSGATYPLGTLLQGYVSYKSDLAWPGSPIAGVHEGRGFLLNVGWTVSGGVTLAASLLCPTFTRYEVIGGRVDVICSAVAGARGVYLELLDLGGTIYWTSGVQTTLAPSETRAICIGAGIPARATSIGGVEWLDLPNGLELDDSRYLRLLVAGNQAGDNITARGAYVRQWFND